jgi:F0F1-type ATP synthase membrane subunit b/b'
MWNPWDLTLGQMLSVFVVVGLLTWFMQFLVDQILRIRKTLEAIHELQANAEQTLKATHELLANADWRARKREKESNPTNDM